MVKKRISGEEKEKLVLDLYYNQNKTYREITKLAGAYPREIKAILKKVDPGRSQSIHSQAYQLFDEGKTLTQVAIALDIRQPVASELFMEYWLLRQQDQLYKIFQEIKTNLRYFLELYKQAIAAGMSIQDVVRALNIAKNDLRSIEGRFLELKRQADSLVASNQNAARTFQDFSNQISDMKKTIDHYKSVINERKLELETITKQKDKLEAYMTHLRNNSEEYSKIIDTVKREMEGTLADPRQILMLAFQSLVESVRKDVSKFHALVYNLPSVNTMSPDYDIIEDTYERVLLNEAEEIYDKMIINYMDNAISDTTSKNKLSFRAQAELDNVENDSASFAAYMYRREEHTFQSE
jgi:hypothetical protein